MSNIIKFPNSESIKYAIHDEKVLSVSGIFHDVEIELSPISDEFEIQINNEYVIGSRKKMAEFLWAMAYMIDSDQEWSADKYPSINK